jgi:CRISPR system Cascade subunit CasE
MFLSKLCPNVQHRQARRDLALPYEMHRTLWRCFPQKDPGRILFRVDPARRGGRAVVLVQSDFQPQWERLEELGPEYLLAAPASKQFQPTFSQGQPLSFRLRANPTRKVATASKTERLAGNKDHGRRIALLREQDQLSWLIHKGEHIGDQGGCGGGFRIPGQWITDGDNRKVANFRVQVVPEGWVRCSKDGHGDGRFYAVRFDGLLEVTDPVRFLSTVEDGIGPAKGFGFGLLSLAPASC